MTVCHAACIASLLVHGPPFINRSRTDAAPLATPSVNSVVHPLGLTGARESILRGRGDPSDKRGASAEARLGGEIVCDRGGGSAGVLWFPAKSISLVESDEGREGSLTLRLSG